MNGNSTKSSGVVTVNRDGGPWVVVAVGLVSCFDRF